MVSSKGIEKKRKPKKFEQIEQTKPMQLSLFDLEPDEDSYSHSIELYDFMPKYFWGKAKRLDGRFLETLKRKFICKGTKYSLSVTPARIEKKKGSKEFYLSKREEQVEDALRKLMTERQSVLLDGEAGIVFTLYQLQKELTEKGHTYSYDQLKESLEILTRVDIEIESEDKELKFIFSPIETLGIKGQDGETQTFVRFSPMVTNGIKSGLYRLINYDKVMSYKSVIARQLHKRMSHHFIQASLTESYEILLTTIVRDFGLKQHSRMQGNLTEIEKAIDEMKKKYVILNCTVEKIYESKPRTKLVDAKFKIQPHFDFISDVKKANARAKKVRGMLK